MAVLATNAVTEEIESGVVAANTSNKETAKKKVIKVIVAVLVTASITVLIIAYLKHKR